MNMYVNTTWSVFKAFVDGKSSEIQWADLSNEYLLKSSADGFYFSCYLPKDESAETIDFEENYKN